MKDIITNQFIDKFKNALDKVEDKSYLIENEYRNVEFFILSTENNSETSFSHIFENSIVSINLDSIGINIFKEVFEKYQKAGEFKIDQNDIDQTWAFAGFYNSSIKFADYYKWLKELKESSNKKTNLNKSTLSHKQKMLALHYLGVNYHNFNNNSQLSKVIVEILGYSEKNTADNITYLEGKKTTMKTEKNLKKMLKLFNHECFDDLTSHIQEELNNK